MLVRLTVSIVVTMAVAQLGKAIGAEDVPVAPVLTPEPVWMEIDENGAPRFITGPAAVDHSLTEREPDFFAVLADDWPEGLVPLFYFESRGVTQLNRLPPRGRAHLTDPLFFALPGPEETASVQGSGTWGCQATHEDGRISSFGWDLAVVDHRVAGRFNRDTDFRYAYINRGTLREGRLELEVEYVDEYFEVIGTGRTNEFKGTWRRTDDLDSGTWTAKRTSARPAIQSKGLHPKPLYEYRDKDSESRRYSVQPQLNESGWTRVDPPLCQIWVRE